MVAGRSARPHSSQEVGTRGSGWYEQKRAGPDGRRRSAGQASACCSADADDGAAHGARHAQARALGRRAPPGDRGRRGRPLPSAHRSGRRSPAALARRALCRSSPRPARPRPAALGGGPGRRPSPRRPGERPRRRHRRLPFPTRPRRPPTRWRRRHRQGPGHGTRVPDRPTGGRGSACPWHRGRARSCRHKRASSSPLRVGIGPPSTRGPPSRVDSTSDPRDADLRAQASPVPAPSRVRHARADRLVRCHRVRLARAASRARSTCVWAVHGGEPI